MQAFLSNVLTAKHPDALPEQLSGSTPAFAWQWLEAGVVSLTPHAGYRKTVIISAGIHGNETAPIELVEQIYQDIGSGQLPLNVRLLLVLGNLAAIRSGTRFVDYDLNRLFCGAHKHVTPNREKVRAEALEALVTDFLADSSTCVARYHYDLHTAIRDSLLPTFALLPYQTHDYDAELLASLNAAGLDGLVYHNAAGHTFTHFTSAKFGVG